VTITNGHQTQYSWQTITANRCQTRITRSFTACCTDLHDGLHADTWTATSFCFQCQREKPSPEIMSICRTAHAELEMQDVGLPGGKWQAFVFLGGQGGVRSSFKTQMHDTILWAIPHPASPALQPTALLTSTHIPNYIHLLIPYPRSIAN